MSIEFLNKFYTETEHPTLKQVRDGRSTWSIVDLESILVGVRSNVVVTALHRDPTTRRYSDYLSLPAKEGFETNLLDLQSFCKCTPSELPSDDPTVESIGVILGAPLDLRALSWVLSRIQETKVESVYLWSTTQNDIPSIGMEWEEGRRRVFLAGVRLDPTEEVQKYPIYTPPKSDLESILELAMVE